MLGLLLSASLFSGHNITYQGTKPMQAFLSVRDVKANSASLDMWEVRDGKTLAAYDVDMTKLLHMIVVADDLTDFQHIHPVLHRNGHFTIRLHVAHSGLHHVYVDGIPHGIGRTVFRFDVPIGSKAAAHKRHFNVAGASQHAGPYTVTLDPIAVPFGEIATVAVHITKDGKPATDLHPYLGAMAHGVFIGTRNLAYMHAHGMSNDMLAMATNDCGDSMMLSMAPLAPGSTIPADFSFQVLAPSGQPYDFWLQFTGGNTLYTVPFLVTSP